jgi:hypothetical protein
MPRPDFLHHTTHYQMHDYTHQHSTTRRDADLFAIQTWADCWDDAHIPRTSAPVRFRRVAIRKRDGFGTGWNHYSLSQTFRYGY